MRLPTKFSQLTLLQFIQLNDLSNSGLKDLDYDINKISILTGKSIADVEAMDIKYFNKSKSKVFTVTLAPNEIPLKSKIIVKGTILYPTISLEDMKVNQLIDFSNVFKSVETDHISKANELLAIMFKPLSLFGKTKYNPDKHAKISELLLSAKAEDCLGLLFFYSNLWMRCEPLIQMCSMSSQMTVSEIQKEILNDKMFLASLNIGVGSTT